MWTPLMYAFSLTKITRATPTAVCSSVAEIRLGSTRPHPAKNALAERLATSHSRGSNSFPPFIFQKPQVRVGANKALGQFDFALYHWVFGFPNAFYE